MNLSINLLLWTTHVTDEHGPVLEMLRKTGYEGVEIPIMTGPVEHYRALGKRLDDLGLGRSGSMAFTEAHINPVSDEPAHRRNAVDHMKWLIDCAQALGASRLIGPMFQTLGRFTGCGPTDEEKRRVVQMLAEVAPLAEQAGLMLAVEPLNRFECYLVNTLADGAELVRRVDHPAVGLMVDTFHANIEEVSVPDAIRHSGDAIVHVHLSENHRGTPGAGHIDFAEVLRALRHIDYNGWLVIETFGRALADLAAATCVWRDLSESPEQCARDGYRHICELLG